MNMILFNKILKLYKEQVLNMKLKSLENRNTAMDIIRIVAVFFVICIHFFLNSGFYGQVVSGTNMYILFILRTLSSVCIPMFLILTGYLMCKKILSKKYYVGNVKTLIIYILASIFCTLFKVYYLNTPIDFGDFILSVLNFSGAPYSWYIELYIGLFLLIPFLNVMYNKLESKRKKQVLVLTLIVITVLPSIINIFSVTSDSLCFNPTLGDAITKLVPAWWKEFYPVTYYITGCYLREYGLKIKTSVLTILFVVCTFVFSSFNYYRSYGELFEAGQYIAWNGFEPYLLGVMFFVLLSRINANKFPKVIRRVIYKISSVSLGIYLISYIPDTIIYAQLNIKVALISDKLIYFLPVTLIVLLCSIFLAFILNVAVNIILGICKELKGIVLIVKGESQIDIMSTISESEVNDINTKIKKEHSHKDIIKSKNQV